MFKRTATKHKPFLNEVAQVPLVDILMFAARTVSLVILAQAVQTYFSLAKHHATEGGNVKA